MATEPKSILKFDDSCRDCGYREIDLPKPLPVIGDDFDWLTRDYDGFRLFMMEELAGRFPERTRWTPADIEVILVEAYSVILDQLSDTLDRAQNEAFLDSAKRPDSTRRLLKLIGYDAVLHHFYPKWSSHEVVLHLLTFKGHDTSTINFSVDLTRSKNIKNLLVWLGFSADELGPTPNIGDNLVERELLALLGYEAWRLPEAIDLEIAEHRLFATQQLEQHWRMNAHDMNEAKQLGPRAIHTNRRMVTLSDYRERIEEHPAVLRAASHQQWTGSWNTITITSILLNNAKLDDTIESHLSGDALENFTYTVDRFHWQHQLSPVDWGPAVSFRSLLENFVNKRRMAGQEVWLKDVVPVGVSINLSVRIAANYYRTEIQNAITEKLGTGPNGFFNPARLSMGQDLYASDLIEWLMTIEGIDAVCLNRFKRVGQRYPDQSGSGIIRLSHLQVARCDNDLQQPEYGYWHLNLHGGQRG